MPKILRPSPAANLNSSDPHGPHPPLIIFAVLGDSPLAYFLHISDKFVNACAVSQVVTCHIAEWSFVSQN